MLNRIQIEEYIKQIPSGLDADERRAAYAVITGFAEDKSVSEISSYYSLNRDDVNYWMGYFSFSDMKENSIGKRSSKTKVIEDYLKTNIGKTVNFGKLADELNISTPTVYNYYNSNRFYFKKLSRGNFEIVDPVVERKASK